MIHRKAAGCIIYSIDEHKSISYLLLRYQAGHWDFAKGHTEHHESIHQTAQREVLEETGLVLQINDVFEYIYSYNLMDNNQQSIHKTVHLFIAQSTDQSIELSAEHSDYVWLPCAQALQRLTYHNAQQALRAANSWLTL